MRTCGACAGDIGPGPVGRMLKLAAEVEAVEVMDVRLDCCARLRVEYRADEDAEVAEPNDEVLRRSGSEARGRSGRGIGQGGIVVGMAAGLVRMLGVVTGAGDLGVAARRRLGCGAGVSPAARLLALLKTVVTSSLNMRSRLSPIT